MDQNGLSIAEPRPSLLGAKKSRQAFFKLIGWYLLPYALATIVGGILSHGHFFRAVRFIYLANVLILPCLYLAWFCGKFAAATFAGAALDVYELGVKCSISLALLATFVYISIIEPQRLQVEEIRIESPKVSGPVRILHLSDLQTQAVGRYEQKVFQRIRQLKPDLIIHTGDLVQVFNAPQREHVLTDVADLFRSLNPKYGIYFVMGDTETGGASISPRDSEKIHWFEELSGAKILSNASIAIKDRAGRFQLLGLSLKTSRYGDQAFIQHWQDLCGKEDFTIVMGHAPDYILDLLDEDIDLCLAGHTHGGQVRLPFLGALLTLSKIPKAWAQGYRQINKLRLNVSAGIGVEHLQDIPPMRFNCPPTMTLFTIN